MRRAAALLAVVAAVACKSPASHTGHTLTDPIPELPEASLIAVAPGSSIRIGAQSEVHLDTALGGGSLLASTHCQLSGDFLIAADTQLASHTVLDGDLTLGGLLALKPQAVVTGTVTNVAPPAIELPTTDELLERLTNVDFGDDAPDIVVDAHRRVTLPAGGSRVDTVRLGQGATLFVDSPVDLEVRLVELEAKAEIVVRDGGRLRVHLLGRLDLAPNARIVQEGQEDADGLSFLLGPDATVSLQPGVEFGPGLLYAPTTTLAAGASDLPAEGISSFRGAIVAQHVWTRGHALLELHSRFLRCPFDTQPPVVKIVHPAGPNEREVPPGTATVAVSGFVTDDVGADSAILTDGMGSQALTFGQDGSFFATAALRADGETTQICASATDCVGRVSEDCVLVAIRHDLEIAFTSPAPGSVLSLAQINITGRVRGGTPLGIEADGVAGFFLDGSFTIKGVPLAVGLNVITVTATSTGGDSAVRQLLVSRGPMPVELLSLAVDGRRQVTLTNRTPLPARARNRQQSEHVWYRMLDAAGVELYRDGVPGTVNHFEHFTGASLPVLSPRVDPPDYATAVVVPLVPAAAEIEFYDEGGHRIGRADL